MSQTIQPDAPLPGIEHIVVLMQENRSFDNVLGNLYPASASFDGIPAGASNSYRALLHHTVKPTSEPPSGKSIYITPNPDPAESQGHMHFQIYNGGTTPTMGGFAQSYYDAHRIEGNPGDIMCYFDSTANDGAGQLPMTAFLARTFAVSDRWFGAGPVQTFPNRMFAFCATAGNFDNQAPIDNIDYWPLGHGYGDVLGSMTATSVFELLDTASNSATYDPSNWKVYFHDVPLSAINSYVYGALTAGSGCVSSFDGSDYTPPHGATFLDDVRAGTLPAFAFIEPRYWSNYSQGGHPANSNHPGNDDYHTLGKTGHPIDCRNGETLLTDVYDALTSRPALFDKTLLIVIYDEHGGVWDHVAPLAAPTPYGPDSGVANAEVYSTTGPRVPAFFVNPAIAAGTVLRPPSGSAYAFDHTSIIATLTAQFGLAGPLTCRDAATPVLSGLIVPGTTPRPVAELAVPRGLLPPRPPGGTPGTRRTLADHEQLVRSWAARDAEA